MAKTNSYNYTGNDIDSIIKNMEEGQDSILTVAGWRAVVAYNFLSAFASFENNVGIGSGITCAFYGFLMPSLGLLAGKSRVLRYSITVNREEDVTTISLLH